MKFLLDLARIRTLKYYKIIDSFNTLSEMVDDRIGTIMDDEVVAQNRQNIKDAWKALGF